eukprot:jgi/Picsp_1/6336/NSC_03685-R1_monothiol glutaredoxin-s16
MAVHRSTRICCGHSTATARVAGALLKQGSTLHSGFRVGMSPFGNSTTGGRLAGTAARAHEVLSRQLVSGNGRRTLAARGMWHRIITSASSVSEFGQAELLPVLVNGNLSDAIPMAPGVYAIYDAQGTLQYVGISRKVGVSVQTHVEALPDLTNSVKVGEMPGAGKEELTEAWKAWIQQAAEETGVIPPGNAPGEKKWQQRRKRMAKPEIKLTPGKGLDDLTCSIEDLIDQVVKTNRCVAFVKGTRYEPACGFSYKVLSMLTEISGQNFEVVNVLDEVYNPGLREAIKEYSQWPTIPQVFIQGEFVGGADIIEEMHSSGELHSLLSESE